MLKRLIATTSLFAGIIASGAPTVLENHEEINVLKQQITNLRNEIEFLKLNKFGYTKRTDIATLASIKLAENATDDEIREYIQKIIDTSIGTNSWSTGDPQVAMLQKINHDNLPILIQSYALSQNNVYIRYALNNMVNIKDKDIVIQNLVENPAIIFLVKSLHCEKDVRDILLNRLKENPHYLSTDWITCSARLRDPEFYPYLENYYRNGANQSHTYKAIKELPLPNLEEITHLIWNNLCSGTAPLHSKPEMAQVVITYGEVSALEYLITGLSNNLFDEYSRKRCNNAVNRHIEGYVSPKDLKPWFDTNKDSLVFNSETKKFYVPTESPQL